MFDPVLAAEVIASPPVGVPQNADPQALMYWISSIVGGIVLGISALFYRTAPPASAPVPAPKPEAAKPDAPPPGDPAQLIFAQGPYQAILDRLGAIALMQERVAGINIELREALAEALRATRHDLKGVLHEMGTANEADAEDIKALLRSLTTETNRLAHVSDTEEIKGLLRNLMAFVGLLDQFIRVKMK